MRYRFWASLDRFWLHVPVGLVVVGLAWVHPVLSGAYVYLFAAYEVNEDRHVRDEAWRDIAGALAGIILGGAAWTIIRLAGRT